MRKMLARFRCRRCGELETINALTLTLTPKGLGLERLPDHAFELVEAWISTGRLHRMHWCPPASGHGYGVADLIGVDEVDTEEEGGAH